MAFRNPIVAGVQLVRSAIESSNYAPGVSGWAIFENGTAEFSSIIIRGASVFDSSALYYLGAVPMAGNLIASISPTGGTDPYGNVYVPGIVAYDSGGDYIQQADSGNVGWNLHLAGLATNGQIGLSAMGSGGAQQGLLELQPPTGSGNGPPIIDLLSESFDSSQPGYIHLANTDELRTSPQSTTTVKHTFTLDGVHIYAFESVSAAGLATIGSNNAIIPGSAIMAPETWHTIASSALWTTTGAANPLRYRVEPQGTGLCGRLDGELLTTGAGPWPANASIITLPVGYRPAQTHPFVTRSDIAVSAGQCTVNVLGPSGGVQNGQVFTAAGQRLFFDGIVFPLD